MDVAQMILDFVAKAAWPAIALAVVFILRHPLRRMVHELSPEEVTAGTNGVSVKFTREKVDEAMSHLGAPRGGDRRYPIANSRRKIGDLPQEIAQEINRYPENAIKLSYHKLRRGLQEAIDVVGEKPNVAHHQFGPESRLAQITEYAKDVGILTNNQVAAADALQEAFDTVNGTGRFRALASSDVAYDYAISVDRLVRDAYSTANQLMIQYPQEHPED